MNLNVKSKIKNLTVLEGDLLEEKSLPSFVVDSMKRQGVVRERSFRDSRSNLVVKQSYFCFVGVAVAGNTVIRSFPKYLGKDEKAFEDIIRVLWKMQLERKLELSENNGEYSNIDNSFSLACKLLRDYLANGLYSDDSEKQDMSGLGTPEWTRTINRFLPVIGKRPVYLNLIFKHSEADPENFFTQVHRAILNQIFDIFEHSGVLKILNLSNPHLYHKSLSSFGGVKNLVRKLKSELSQHFDNRRITLLRLMLAYLENINLSLGKETIFLCGTTAFNLVWEKTCAFVLGNILEKPINSLQLNDDSPRSMKDLIEGAKWELPKGSKPIETEKMRLDMAMLYSFSGKKTLIIADAKYYKPAGDGSNGLPGVEDVAKQHIYEMLFKEFAQKHGINKIVNCFLFPTVKSHQSIFGQVYLPILVNKVQAPIQLIYYPAGKVFEAYLKGKRDLKIELNC